MWDGTTKLAKDLEIGDQLIGYYIPGMIPEQEEGWADWTESVEVEGTYEKTTLVAIKLDTFSSYFLINNDLKITLEHQILINKKDTNIWAWVDTPFIEVGDKMKGNNNEIIEVQSIQEINETITVVSPDVEKLDNYLAGENPVIIHNLGGGGSFGKV